MGFIMFIMLIVIGLASVFLCIFLEAWISRVQERREHAAYCKAYFAWMKDLKEWVASHPEAISHPEDDE